MSVVLFIEDNEFDRALADNQYVKNVINNIQLLVDIEHNYFFGIEVQTFEKGSEKVIDLNLTI
jgi:hypothetical protein